MFISHKQPSSYSTSTATPALRRERTRSINSNQFIKVKHFSLMHKETSGKVRVAKDTLKYPIRWCEPSWNKSGPSPPLSLPRLSRQHGRQRCTSTGYSADWVRLVLPFPCKTIIIVLDIAFHTLCCLFSRELRQKVEHLDIFCRLSKSAVYKCSQTDQNRQALG